MMICSRQVITVYHHDCGDGRLHLVEKDIIGGHQHFTVGHYWRRQPSSYSEGYLVFETPSYDVSQHDMQSMAIGMERGVAMVPPEFPAVALVFGSLLAGTAIIVIFQRTFHPL